jgi:hypothetical protein
MTTWLRKHRSWALLVLPFALWIGAKVYDARSISPRNVATVRDYFDRFGEPRRIQIVQRDGEKYYEFTGELPSTWLLILPSAPPAYIFNEQGLFADWCRDPGDSPAFR